MIRRSPDEERWNAGSHLLGGVLAAVGLVWMCFQLGGNWQSKSGIACVVYAFLLMLMYTMSTVSHWFRDDKNLSRYRSLDQACIFLLITGTYTPFSVHFWDTLVANGLLMTMWAISIAGFFAKAFFSHRVNRVSVIGYVVLGWMPILGLPFHEHWPNAAMGWVLAGGVVYSLGTIFLLNDQKGKWFHLAWHVSVIVASAIHFAAVAMFVLLDLPVAN